MNVNHLQYIVTKDIFSNDFDWREVFFFLFLLLFLLDLKASRKEYEKKL